MFYYLYQITNLVNNKIYIGVHKTKSFDDRYMGSGKVIQAAIRKHGILNFEKIILEYFGTQSAMYAKEAEVVDDEFLARNDVYNLRRGGFGGFDYLNKIGLNNSSKTKESASRGGLALGERIRSDPSFKAELAKKSSIRIKSEYETGLRINSGCFADALRAEMVIRAQSLQAKEKRQNSYVKICHQQGENNSNYGIHRIGIYLNELIKKVLPEEVDEYLRLGWKLGFKEKRLKEIKPKNSKRNWSKLICKHCGCEFEASQRDVRRNRKYCGNKCNGLAIRK